MERLKDLKAKLEGDQAVAKGKKTLEREVGKEQGAFIQEEGLIINEHQVEREGTKDFVEVLDKIGTKGLMEALGNPTIGAIEREKLESIIKSLQGREVIPAYEPTERQEVRQTISNLQVALDEEYKKHQMGDTEEMVCYEEVLYNQMGDGEEAANEREEDLGETPEEINYLEEIEKKLKDIQARLKVSDILEENMRKMRPIEKVEVQEEGISESVAIEDIAYKIVEYKNKLAGCETMATNKEEIERLQRIFERNKPCAAPIGAENIEWRKISLSELVSIPSLSVEWCSQPFITFSYYKYNEFILGREKESGQYYLGVPDVYHPDREQIRESDPKIQRFLGKENATPVMGGYGYWLVKL